MTQNRSEKKAARALAAERGIPYTAALSVVRAGRAAAADTPNAADAADRSGQGEVGTGRTEREPH